MSIIDLKIKSFKCIENLEVEINGKNVYLVGENGVGKTSFQQVIKFLLGDEKCLPLFGDIDAEMTIEVKGRPYTLKGKRKDGKRVVMITGDDGITSDKMAVIKGITGCSTFNVDEFISLSKTAAGRKNQIEMAKNILPLDIREEISRLDVESTRIYDDRTDVNREAKSLKSSIDLMSQKTPIEKPEDIAEVTGKILDAESNNSHIESIKLKIKDAQADVVEYKEKITDIEKELSLLKEKLQSKKQLIEDKEVELLNTIYLDVDPLKVKIKSYQEHQQKYSEYLDYQQRKDLFDALSEKSKCLTDSIAKIDLETRRLISENNKYVPGLEIKTLEGEQMLFYNGIPVDENSLSTAEKMELGWLLKKAESPDSDIVFIERGESLGHEKMQSLLDMAKKNGLQLFIEEVRRGTEKLEILIEGDSV
jgi:predicted ATP-dependent endonuclease of OLD family